jgi:hypothetical protein
VPALGFGGMGEVFRAGGPTRDHTGAVRIPETVTVRAAARQRRRGRTGLEYESQALGASHDRRIAPIRSVIE